jgi:hypothetical protein
LRELERKTIRVQEELHTERERTPFWQSGKRRALEEGEKMAGQAVYNIHVLSNIKLPDIEVNLAVDLTGAVKSVEIIIGKSAEIVSQVKELLRHLSDRTFACCG